MYGPADDARQDRELAALAQSVKELREAIAALELNVRNVHTRIDRLPTPSMPPVVGFWGFLLRLFGRA